MDRRGFLAGAIALAAGAAAAQPFGGVNQPRRHLIMRHALAPGTGDPAKFRLRECGTQRNLNDVGRDQARRTGARLRDLGVSVDRVLSSQWCRCLETARLLALGEVEEAPSLNSFFEDRGRAGEQTEATRALLLSLAASETAMLVTHQVNITALLSVFPSSGELFAFEIDEAGRTTVIDSLLVS